MIVAWKRDIKRKKEKKKRHLRHLWLFSSKYLQMQSCRNECKLPCTSGSEPAPSSHVGDCPRGWMCSHTAGGSEQQDCWFPFSSQAREIHPFPGDTQ